MKTKIMLFKEFRKIIKDEFIKYKFRLDTRGSKPIYSVNKFIKRYPILIRLNTF
jgi:hypothetical protein